MNRSIGAVVAVLSLAISACSGSVSEPLNDEPVEASTSTTASTLVSTTTTTAADATVSTPSTMPASSVPAPDGELAWVVEVIDGDTLTVTVQGIEERLRLIGINTPESGECLADQATNALEALVAGQEVTLGADVNDRDQYGRLLRYVWVGDLFVNEQMVANGMALARRYEPDTALADLLDAAQETAKGNGYGMWAPDSCGTRTDADLVIAEIQFDAPGNDNDNPNGEWARVENRGGDRVDLSGWVLKDESASHRYAFAGGFSLDPGSTVTIYTGCGIDSNSELYWCEQGSAVWNNSGDTGFLLDPSGNIMYEYGY